jgi:PAS domain S-box-containing protein
LPARIGFGVVRGSGTEPAERRAALAGCLTLLAVVVAQLVVGHSAFLLSFLVLGPLVAAFAARPAVVAGLTVAALLLTLPLAALAARLGVTRHFVSLGVIAGGGALAVLLSRTLRRLVDLRRAEQTARRRLELLDRTSTLIGSPPEAATRLEGLTRLPVPDLCDVCIVDLLAGEEIRGVVVSASDPADADAVRELRGRWPIDAAGEHPVALAIRHGTSQLLGAITAGTLAPLAHDPEHLAVMQRLDFTSAVVVPLVARGTTLGVLSVLRLHGGPAFDEGDRALVSDLAARAALAVDNARLFDELRASDAQREAILGGLAESVTVQDAEGRLVYVNQAAADMLGLPSPDAVLAAPSRSLYARYDVYDEHGAPFDLEQLPGRVALRGETPEPTLMRHVDRETGDERWTVVKASAIRGADGAPQLAVNVIEDVTEQRRAADATRFLSEASKLLASSLEFEGTLQRVADAAILHVADWCGVDIVDDRGRLRPVAVAHADPERVAFARRLRERYPTDQAATTGAPQVVRTGVPELYPEIPEELLEQGARDPEHLELLRELELGSILIVPLTAGDRTLGVLTLVTHRGGRRLTQDDVELAEELGRRAGVAVENARIHRERTHVATTLQRSLLPPRLPVIPGLTIAARFRAAGESNQVGGDFYDLFEVDGGWIVAIGDVTGKGPDAAAITSLARYTMRTAGRYESDPVEILRRLNEALLRDGDRRQLCTAVCMRIDDAGAGTAPLRVTVACGGHPSPFRVTTDGELDELCGPGPLLGAFDDADWEPSVIDLHEHDGIVLYTDGVTDTRGRDGRFGSGRLREVLRDAAGADADGLAGAVDDALLAFEEGPQRDDVALLVLCAGTRRAAGDTVLLSSPAGRA